MLLFGCYFPCNGSSKNSTDAVTKILGYIDSVISINPGFRLCILGDLNFVCTSNNIGFCAFNDFVSSLNVVSCDDLISESSYTYCHLSLNQKSFLDHVFNTYDLKQHIQHFAIIDDDLNTSDHLPVAFCLAMRKESAVTTDKPVGISAT